MIFGGALVSRYIMILIYLLILDRHAAHFLSMQVAVGWYYI